MLARPRPFGAAVWEDMGAMVVVDHANVATDVPRLAGVAEWMVVDGTDPVAGLETGCGGARHRHRGARSQDRRDMLGLEYALPGCLVGRAGGLAARQFLGGHQPGLHKQFFQPRKPVFVIAVPQII